MVQHSRRRSRIAAIAVVARGLETRGRPLEELVEGQQVR